MKYFQRFLGLAWVIGCLASMTFALTELAESGSYGFYLPFAFFGGIVAMFMGTMLLERLWYGPKLDQLYRGLEKLAEDWAQPSLPGTIETDYDQGCQDSEEECAKELRLVIERIRRA